MYAVYNYQAGSTQANVLADIVKILTGETNKANLSANCVQANTTITSTTATDWAEYDASAGTNHKVLRRLDQGGSVYKYLGIKASSATALDFIGYESWNSGTHTGTNTTTTASTVWDSSGGGYLYIYATAKNIHIKSWTVAGYQNSLFNFELSRIGIPSTYPAHATGSGNHMGYTNGTVYVPKIKNHYAAGDVTNASCNILLEQASMTNSTTQGIPWGIRDTSDAISILAYKFIVTYSTAAYGMLGLVNYDILGFNAGAPVSQLDEISYSGTTYVIFATSGGSASNAHTLVPKA